MNLFSALLSRHWLCLKEKLQDSCINSKVTQQCLEEDINQVTRQSLCFNTEHCDHVFFSSGRGVFVGRRNLQYTWREIAQNKIGEHQLLILKNYFYSWHIVRKLKWPILCSFSWEKINLMKKKSVWRVKTAFGSTLSKRVLKKTFVGQTIFLLSASVFEVRPV